MSSAIPQPLQAWVNLAGPAKVIAEVRRRLEARGAVSGEINVPLSDGERREIGRLLGLKWVTSGKNVTVAALEKALVARSTTLLLLAQSLGSLDDHRADRARKAAARQGELDAAGSALVGAGVPEHVAQWFIKLRRRPKPGTGKLLSHMKQVASVWTQLPEAEDQPLSLAVFAARTTEDPHALDKDTDLGRALALLITAVTLHQAEPAADLAARIVPGAITASETWRSLWESRGIVCDQVSSVVLCLNLPLVGRAPAATLATAGASCGEPIWLTHRSLTGEWAPQAGLRAVYVCENPAVVEAAADRYGADCAPVVCTYGWPSSAALTLLQGLERAGVRLLIRADDDAAGQKITAKLLTHTPDAGMWRYRLRSVGPSDTAKEYEEQVLQHLLEDLKQVKVE
ncbi:TIGR02679 domain-containing protein [Streptomyces sp. NPDC051218]|uniref:TIGR02679 domain-containing protein n=1 Tax=Streptomyces sp. NPDC051218 TaxID=3365645 RepID=UPI00379ADE73